VVDLEELSERVSASCSATPSDCSAVIIGLVAEISKSLDQGNIVRLGQLGSFQVSVQGTSSISPEELTSKNISRSSIVFRPGKKLKTMLNQLKFYKKK
jgi:predicted histone-like DNA-binding protein